MSDMPSSFSGGKPREWSQDEIDDEMLAHDDDGYDPGEEMRALVERSARPALLKGRQRGMRLGVSVSHHRCREVLSPTPPAATHT